MDYTYCWAFVAAVIGGAAGFQGIYESYRKDSFSGIRCTPGLLYLLSRAAVPAATFCGLYATGLVTTNLWLWALVSGTGSEALLRSNFFIKKADMPSQQAAAGSKEAEIQPDVMFGPLDLLKWWQDLALTSLGPHLGRDRLTFVKKYTPTFDNFPKLCGLIKDNLGSLQDTKLAAEVRVQVDQLCGEYQNDPSPDSEHYRIGLGLMLERALPSRKDFHTAVHSATTDSLG
jgi:hypothetical protein